MANKERKAGKQCMMGDESYREVNLMVEELNQVYPDFLWSLQSPAQYNAK